MATIAVGTEKHNKQLEPYQCFSIPFHIVWITVKMASVRLPLYCILWFFSVVVFGLTITRLNYTLHLPKGDPLNHGADFYDPVVAELLVCSLLAFGFAPFIVKPDFMSALRVNLFSEVSPAVTETIALAALWLLWLIGAGIATSIWPNLSFCYNFAACRVLAAMTAFAWLGWLTVCGLLVISLFPFFQKDRPPISSRTIEWVGSTSLSVVSAV